MTMSQHFHDRNRPADSYNTSTFYDNSASAVREQQSPNAASQNSYASQDLRSQRKPAPSPLQTTSNAKSSSYSGNTTPTAGVFADSIRGSPGRMVELDRQTSLRGDEPRSPKERLDDLLATERSFYEPGNAPSPPMMSNSSSRSDQSSRPIGNNSRSASDPVAAARFGGRGSTATPPMSSVPEHRTAMGRGIPRTSSIDSAISSISGGTAHSHKASQDSLVRGESPDIGNLINAAGSAEAVIHHLLKEKQAQAAQNTQLWRLVDKQRAMIMGLNKDLERALKDKDRYRKKMKDSMAAMGEAGKADQDDAANAGAQGRDSTAAPKPGGLGALVSAGMRDHDNDNDDSQAPYPLTPEDEKYSKSTKQGSSRIPETSSYAPNNFNPDTSRDTNGDSQREPANAPPVPPSRVLPLRSSENRQNNASDPVHTPTSSVTEIAAQTKLMQSPPRKAPPAPLNLGKQKQASSHLHQAQESAGLDEDYDDVLEVEEIPAFNERGRRKTREEDDKEREIAAMKDAEARSLSKKSKTRPSGAPAQPEVPLPTMKHAIQISPPEMHVTAPDSVSGSLAGMMNSTSNSNLGGDVQKRTVLAPPPMSPGLPASPRPMAGMNPQFHQKNLTLGPQQVASPPMSARMGAFPTMPLSPRAPRQPIPLPPNTPMSMSMQTPSGAKFAPAQLAPQAQIPEEAESPIEKPVNLKTAMEPGEVYHGFMTDEYPEFLLPPNALPSIAVRVASSRLKPSRASMMFPNRMDEDPVFTLAVFSRNGDEELWRVEKDSLSLHYLDQDLKRHKAFSSLKTPEKSLFTGHAPAKIDARRVALDQYLDDVLNTPMNTKSALLICHYLSTNTLEPLIRVTRAHDSGDASPSRCGPDGKPFKHGYLTKRGKNFGGWKARYFILDGPVLKYYESPPPQGAHLGAIKLQHSKIGKQQQQSQDDNSSDADNQYRHAFLILEPKRKDSTAHVRHVLCAESDQERDEWVEALVQYMEPVESDDEAPHELSQRSDTGSSSRTTGANAKKKLYGSGKSVNESNDDLRALPYGATVPGQAPRLQGRSAESGTPSPSLHGTDRDSQRSRENGTPSPPLTRDERDNMTHSESGVSISGPQRAVKIEDGAAWGNKPATANSQEDKKASQKKRSFFGFGGNKARPSSESQDQEFSSLSQMSFDQHGPIRAVFGAPLGDAVKYNHPVNVDIDLPAVVYRCVEYLESKNAIQEEGIFRLSGSSVVIKALRERFNIEGDVDLITDGQYYDIHAVASLLKLYLRELPTTILTRELHLDFLGVTEIHDEKDKVIALCQLVHKLPKANNMILRYLSQFLIMVVNNCEVNKMTVRNVGIVFSPTLNIPAPVLALFLQQYEAIFETEPQEMEAPPVEVKVTAAPLTPEDIRSPRKQHFQELPTPSYTQDSFPRGPPPTGNTSGIANKSAYDTGFIPMQPAYENSYGQSGTGQTEYGSLDQKLGGGASYDQFPAPSGVVKHFGGSGLSPPPTTTKTKRRESSMFGMMGQKKPAEDKREQLLSKISSPLAMSDPKQA